MSCSINKHEFSSWRKSGKYIKRLVNKDMRRRVKQMLHMDPYCEDFKLFPTKIDVFDKWSYDYFTEYIGHYKYEHSGRSYASGDIEWMKKIHGTNSHKEALELEYKSRLLTYKKIMRK